MLGNSETIKKLRNKIKEFGNEDIYVEIKGALQFNITIKKAKILVGSTKIFITNEEEYDFIIELYYLDNIEIKENIICIEMSNDIKITLDY